MAEEEKSKESKQRLEGLLKNLDKEENSSGSPFSFLSASSQEKPSIKNKTSAEKTGNASSVAGQKNVQDLEQMLQVEKERALRAEILLQEKENVRKEMEDMFKNLREQYRNDRLREEMDKERIASRSRIESLESRLDEMQNLFLSLVKEIKIPGSAAPPDSGSSALSGALKTYGEVCESLKQKLETLNRSLEDLQSRMERLLQENNKLSNELKSKDELARFYRGQLTGY